jgi:hypothetical protein
MSEPTKKVFKRNRTYIVRSGPHRSLFRLVSCPFGTPEKELRAAVAEAMRELHTAFLVANARFGDRTIADEWGPRRYQDVWVYPAFELVVERLPYMGGSHRVEVTIRETERLPWERARRSKK